MAVCISLFDYFSSILQDLKNTFSIPLNQNTITDYLTEKYGGTYMILVTSFLCGKNESTGGCILVASCNGLSVSI